MNEPQFWGFVLAPNNVILAFSLTLLAGLSTGIGSFIALLARRTNTRFLAGSLGFSAGVMIYVSLVDIIAAARVSLVEDLGIEAGNWATVAGFFGGIVVIALIDRFIPTAENPHEVKKLEELILPGSVRTNHKLMRTGLFTALAIALHNFPEGIATFTAAIYNPNLGIAIALAIAIHNIPEGIAVSVPIFYATGSRKQAFVYSFLSGLAEPLGAFLGYVVLKPFMNDLVFGVLFSGVAGIMIYISIDELLPTAEAYGEHHYSVYGLIGGMAVMAVSLLLFL
jgi:ZIP family zinc transporter